MAAIQAYAPASRYTYPKPQFTQLDQGRQTGVRNSGSQTAEPVNRSASLTAERYSSTSMYLEYTNKDGDSVSLSIERVQYQKAQMTVQAGGESDEQWQKIVDRIKDEFVSMKDTILREFVKSLRGEDRGWPEALPAIDGAEDVEAVDVPEEWNAENTSQRIVDFAVSFFDAFEGAGEDFLKQIKDAVEAGFKQARDIMGELPKSVNKLIDDTYALVMVKLDAWAKDKGIGAQVGQDNAGTKEAREQNAEEQPVEATA